MRKFIIRIAFVAVAVFGIVAGSVSSLKAASDTANANAAIVAAIAISNTVALEFASIVPSGVADALIVSPASGKTCGAALTCTGTVTGASFDVTGGSGLTYSITLPASVVIDDGGPNNMTVNAFPTTEIW